MGATQLSLKFKNVNCGFKESLNMVLIGCIRHCAPHAGVVKHRSSALSKLILEMRHISPHLL